MKATIYHYRDADGRMYFGCGEPWDGAALTKVAEVEASDLDDAYMRTNHIESDWTLGEGVELVPFSGRRGENRHRSTSIGDVIIFNDRSYVVETCGFGELEGDEWQAFMKNVREAV